MAFSGKVTEYFTKQPLAGIPVSDGRNTVFTDSEGNYTLPGWERARVINVGVLTKKHDDWFICTEFHKGDYNFAIQPAEVSSSNFNFLHVSDTEIERREFCDWVPFMRESAKNNGSAFFINTGDLCIESGLKKHYLAMNAETIGCPVRYAIGNHDFAGYDYGEQLYERYYGPTWYSFDCGDVHMVVLSIGFGDNMSGYKRTDEWEWLQEDLKLMAPGKRPIIFCHDICAADETGFRPEIEGLKTDLREAGLIAWVFGHYHFHYLHEYDGVFNMCSARPDSGGIDSSVAGIRKVSMAGHDLSSEIIYNMPGSDGVHDKAEWCTQLPGYVEFLNPIEAEGDVIVCTGDDGYPKKCGIYRLDGKSGKIKWGFSPETSFKNDPAYEDGRVYAQDTKGNTYCLNFDDGSVIWHQKAAILGANFSRSNVIIAENLLISGCPSHIHAYDKITGELIWDTVTSHGDRSPARHLYDSKRKQLIISLNWKWICALDLATGEMKWENKMSPLCWFNTASPVCDDDYIYTCGLTTAGKLNPDTGEAVLTSNIEDMRIDVSGKPCIDGDTIYIPSGTHGVAAVDRETLKTKMIFGCGDAKLFTVPYTHGELQTVEGTPIVKGNTLIFAASDGCVYFYDKHTGKRLRRIKVGKPIINSPIVKDGGVIVADFTGRVIKFK